MFRESQAPRVRFISFCSVHDTLSSPDRNKKDKRVLLFAEYRYRFSMLPIAVTESLGDLHQPLSLVTWLFNYMWFPGVDLKTEPPAYDAKFDIDAGLTSSISARSVAPCCGWQKTRVKCVFAASTCFRSEASCTDQRLRIACKSEHETRLRRQCSKMCFSVA
jgi:hypothetical protein